MTKEQEEAIEILKNLYADEYGHVICKKCVCENRESCLNEKGEDCQVQAVEIILNLTQEQQIELKKKDKIITDLKQKVLNENYARNKAEDKYTELLNKFSPIYDIEQQAELKKKDKIINLMAEIIRIEDIEEVDDLEDFCEEVGKDYSECKYMSSKCKACIKQYFERKVGNE